MLTKSLEGTRYVAASEVGSFQLDYYVVEEEMNCNKLFGVEVVKRDKVSGHDWFEERECIHPLTESKEFVREMVEKLIYFSVSPVTLTQVVDELYSLLE
ncbi:DUF6514 family protein [Vallitalea okinawensis]|uniref:DUF6514 family protein n=1 Tax=Vallitalea okinawensis TaxID=2078660 RepID=UPI000CFD3899|nr:DUF6514 family protein [Vallitalea okinawensis]